MKEEELHELIKTQISEIGDMPSRQGLKDTPKRVVKSWQELYSGYREKPEDILTVFDAGTYDQIVLLKDCELYSMCEHHMLPFFGKAHIAYIPDDKVIGISKLARLLEIYSRRLQIQERIGEQVTEAIMDYLGAKGAACIIEAEHMCIRMRGVGKQNSIMVTSSLKGAFFTSSAARMELMQLIK
jgi:GTP cyclohydrolase I